jgi:cell division protein FtsW
VSVEAPRRSRRVSFADRAAVNPFAPLNGLLDRPMASFYLLLSSAGLLLAFGLVMVLSASSVHSFAATQQGSSFTIFNKQLQWAILGLPACWLGLRLPVRAYRVLGYVFLVVAVAMLLALLLFPAQIGVEQNGSYRWIALGPYQVQPSEPAKLALALWGADVLVRKRGLLGSFRHLAVPLFPVTLLLLAMVGFHDLGTASCLLIVVFALLWVVGVRLRTFAAVIGPVAMIAAALVLTEGYRMRRLTSFLDPFAAYEKTKIDGYQAIQGLYSLSTGGWWGVGLGASRGKWDRLPEAYNDFIFAVIGEELGVIGCVVVIALFCVLAYAGLRIARRVDDPFAQLVAAACTMWLVGQAFINMGAVVGLLPITGIPLPLISAGGSSLVLTMFVIGMLASFARLEPDAVTALHARGRTAWARLSGIPLPPLPRPATTPSDLRNSTPFRAVQQRRGGRS